MRMLMLAARNLLRNTRRTVLTLAAISVGLAMMMFTVCLQKGFYAEMIDKAISQMAGHVVVEAKGFRDEQDPEVVVTDTTAVVEALRAALPDAVIAPRSFLGGLLVSPTNSVGIGLSGVDPVAEAKVQDLDDQLVAGEWLDDDIHGILIGKSMAETLGVGVGDKLVYMGQYGGGEVDSRLFRVKGIFRTGSADLDGFFAVVPLRATQDILGRDDVCNMVTVHLPDARQSEAEAKRLAALLHRDDLEVLPWSEALSEMYALIQVDRSSGDVMLVILGLIVAMGVLNTMLMSVLERIREFGVMLSIGMKPRQVAVLVLLEGLVLGLTGAVLGVLLGVALAYPMVAHGIDYSTFIGGETMESGGIIISSLVRGQYDPGRMALYASGAVVFTILAAVYPAVHISRLQPVEAARHV